jgi:predicted DNA-binding transcriptional regulator YafY
MNQLARIQHIYHLLQTNTLDLQELLEAFNQVNCHISLRQLQRDMQVLPVLMKQDEKFETYRNNKRIKSFRIVQLEVFKPIKPIKRVAKPSVVSTNFFESNTIFDVEASLNLWNKFINNKLIIVISDLQYDSTGDNFRFTQRKIHFAPLQLLFHHGTYYVAGYNANKRIIQIFELEQIKNYKLSGFEERDIMLPKLLAIELNKRFGVSKNIDDNTYAITLEFSSVTGQFIMRHFWHSSQTFKEQNGKIIMQLECGINRELIGWLYMWMYNVRVVDPPILKEYYTKALKKITQVNNELQPLVYQNLINK